MYSSMSGVPPIPFTNARTVSPPLSPRSATIGVTSHSAMSSTGASFSRRRPGSPWIPIPISTSSSPSANVGVPAAGTMHDVKARPIERPWPLTFAAIAATSASEPPASARAPAIFSTRTVHADAPASRGVQRVLDRDVVVGDDRGDLHLARDELGGHLEVQDVTGVVLDDVEHPGAAVDGAGRGLHLIGDRRREDVAGTGRVEHAQPDEAAVERLVARAAAGQQGDLAPLRAAGAKDDVVGGVDPDEVGVSAAEAREALGDDVLDVVDELLHRAAGALAAMSGCSFGRSRIVRRSSRRRGSAHGRGRDGRGPAPAPTNSYRKAPTRPPTIGPAM